MVIYKLFAFLMVIKLLCITSPHCTPITLKEIEQTIINRHNELKHELDKNLKTFMNLKYSFTNPNPLEFALHYRYLPESSFIVDDSDFETKQWLTLRIQKNIAKLFHKNNIQELMDHERSEILSEMTQTLSRELNQLRHHYCELLIDKNKIIKTKEILKHYDDMKNSISNPNHSFSPKQIQNFFKQYNDLNIDLKKKNDMFEFKQNAFKTQYAIQNRNIDWIKPSIIKTIASFEFIEKHIDEQLLNLNHSNEQKNEILRNIKLKRKQSLTPFIGYKQREDELNTWKQGMEVGLSFKTPLFFRHKKNSHKKAPFFTSPTINKKNEQLKTKARQYHKNIKLKLLELKHTQTISNIGPEQLRSKDISQSLLHHFKHNVSSLKNSAALLENQLKLIMKTCDLLILLPQLEIKDLCSIDPFETDEALNKQLIHNDLIISLWYWWTDKPMRYSQLKNDIIHLKKHASVKTLYLSAAKDFLTHLTQKQLSELNSFIDWIPLCGDAKWIFPKNKQKMINKLNDILKFDPTKIHFDIEPQSLENWNNHKQEYLELYFQTLSIIHQYLFEKGIKIGIDCPVFFDKIDQELLNKIFQLVDTCILMNYETTDWTVFLSRIQTETKLLNQNKVNFKIGIRAKDFSSIDELGHFIKKINKHHSHMTHYQGIAIHDYDHLKYLI